MVVYRVGEYSRRAGGFAGGYRRVVDEFIGGAIFLQPADDNHSFGHGKAESLAALAQSMFISGSALFLFLTGIQHLISPTPMTDPVSGLS